MEQETKLHSAGVGHKARNVAATNLECGAAEAERYPVPRYGPSSTQEGVAGHGDVDRAYKWPGNPPIPCNEAAGSGVCGDMLEFKLEVSMKGQALMQAHEALAALTQLVVVASHWSSDAPGNPQALDAGQARAAAAREQVLALVLHNTGNTCYQTPLCCPGCGHWFMPARFRLGATAMRN